MILLFLLLISIAIILVFLEDYLGNEKYYIYIVFGFVLILVAGLKPIGMDPDAETYEQFFYGINTTALETPIEHSYVFFSNLFRPIYDDVHIIFLFYAFIGISLKLLAIYRLSQWVFMPLAVYLSGYFLLHDCIQIRAAVASGAFLMAMIPLANGQRLKALPYYLFALVFHYSSAILFVTLFLGNKSLSKLWKIALASILPVGILMYLTHIDFFTAIPIPYIAEKIELYQKLNEKGTFDYPILLQGAMWIRVFVFYVTLYFYDLIYAKSPYLPLLLKIMGLSIFCYFAFASIPVVSLRIHELIGIVEIIIIPYIFYTILPEYAGKILVCAVSMIAITYRLFILKPFDLSF